MTGTSIILGGVLALEASQVVAAQASVSPAATPDAMSGTLQMQIVILVSTVIGFIFTLFRENRNRKWDMEDRRIAREEQMARTHVLTTAVGQAAQASAEASKKVDRATDHLSRQIEENTQISRVAFREANDVNAKIAEQNRLIAAAVARFTPDSMSTLARVDSVTQDTNARVRDMDGGTNDDDAA